jgi:hypothetical protein
MKAAATIRRLSLSIGNRPFVANERPRTDSLSANDTAESPSPAELPRNYSQDDWRVI